MAAQFRAIVRTIFEVTSRGTVLAVDILDGTIRQGDSISIPTPNGPRNVQVLAIEFVDHNIGKPTFRSEVGLVVGDVRAAEVLVGAEVRAVSVGRSLDVVGDQFELLDEELTYHDGPLCGYARQTSTGGVHAFFVVELLPGAVFVWVLAPAMSTLTEPLEVVASAVHDGAPITVLIEDAVHRQVTMHAVASAPETIRRLVGPPQRSGA